MVSRLFFKIRRNYFRMPSIKLTDYDVIGLDLDNTLLEYNLTNFFNLQYKFLVNYLTEKKGYNKSIFTEKLSENDADFIQRGLFLDFAKGNLLNLRNDGFILKAAHGTREMDDSLVKEVYGTERNWSVTDKLVNNLFSLWDNNETRSFLDFTDSIATLLFAKAVDSVDMQGQPSTYQVWPDLLEAIVEMYQTDSSFSQTIASNLLEYMKPCDKDILIWLKNLKKHAKLILITGAEIEVAQVTLPMCLGPNYDEYFDIIVYNAKKPGFFSMSRPFLTLDNQKVDDIVLGKHYKQGNWSDMYKTFALVLKKTPSCVYIGDNPIQDIFTPTMVPDKLDVIALIEEVSGEGLIPGFTHPHSKYISSKFWGSFIYTSSGFTFMGDVLRRSAKLVIPSLKVLADKPLDFEHQCILKNL